MKMRDALGTLHRIGGLGFLVDTIAFLAVLSAFYTGYSSLTLSLGIISAAFSAITNGAMIRRAGAEATDLLGSGAFTRVAVYSVACIIAESSATASIWIGMVVLGGALAIEPVLKILYGHSVQFVYNIPSMSTDSGPTFNYVVVYIINTILVIVSIVAASGSATGRILFYTLLIITVCLINIVIIETVRGNRRRKAVERSLYNRLASLEPEFIFYFDGPRSAVFQMGMWLPYLEHLGKKYTIVVRNRTSLDAVRRITTRPIIYREARQDLDAVIVPTVTTVFYANLSIKNAQMVWYNQLNHVQLNHGESDKKSSYNPAYKMYDFAFVAGQAGVNRFHHNDIKIPDGAIKIVGRPQVQNIERRTRKIVAGNRPTVLYAPTWAGFHNDMNHCSLHVGHQLLAYLIACDCNIIFRPHPFSYRSRVDKERIKRLQGLLRADQKESSRRHTFGKPAEVNMDLYECFNSADALVSDVSSVIGDFLYSEKPFITIAVAAEREAFGQQFPMSEGGYVIDAYNGVAHGLCESVNSILRDDYRFPYRRELRKFHLGDFPLCGYTNEFIRIASAVIDRTPIDQ